MSGTFWQATQPVSAASLPLPTGAATEATLDARTGALTEAAPATDTASSGLNGRLQRVAQRLTSLIAQLPSSLVSGRLDVNVGNSPTVDTELPAAAALSDALGNPTAPAVGAHGLLWDPINTAWVRKQALHQGTALSSAARTATTASSAFTNYCHSGVLCILDITANAGGATVQVFIEAFNPTTSTWVRLHSAPTALGAVATTGHMVGPGAVELEATVGYVYHAWQTHLPVIWRVNCVHANATSITYSVSYSYLK